MLSWPAPSTHWHHTSALPCSLTVCSRVPPTPVHSQCTVGWGATEGAEGGLQLLGGGCEAGGLAVESDGLRR